MVGDVYDYDSLKIYIMSGELRKIIFFRDSDEYQKMLENGMRIGKSVIFNNETDKIDKFFLRIGPVMGPFLIIYAQVMLELLE